MHILDVISSLAFLGPQNAPKSLAAAPDLTAEAFSDSADFLAGLTGLL